MPLRETLALTLTECDADDDAFPDALASADLDSDGDVEVDGDTEPSTPPAAPACALALTAAVALARRMDARPLSDALRLPDGDAEWLGDDVVDGAGATLANVADAAADSAADALAEPVPSPHDTVASADGDAATVRTTPVTLALLDAEGLRLTDPLDVELGDPVGLLDARTVGDVVTDLLADHETRVLVLLLGDGLGDGDARGDTVPDSVWLVLPLSVAETAAELDGLLGAEGERVLSAVADTRADAELETLVIADTLAAPVALLRSVMSRVAETHVDGVVRGLIVAVGARVIPVPNAVPLSKGDGVASPLIVAPACAAAPTVPLTDTDTVVLGAALLLPPGDTLTDAVAELPGVPLGEPLAVPPPAACQPRRTESEGDRLANVKAAVGLTLSLLDPRGAAAPPLGVLSGDADKEQPNAALQNAVGDDDSLSDAVEAADAVAPPPKSPSPPKTEGDGEFVISVGAAVMVGAADDVALSDRLEVADALTVAVGRSVFEVDAVVDAQRVTETDADAEREAETQPVAVALREGDGVWDGETVCDALRLGERDVAALTDADRDALTHCDTVTDVDGERDEDTLPVAVGLATGERDTVGDGVPETLPAGDLDAVVQIVVVAVNTGEFERVRVGAADFEADSVALAQPDDVDDAELLRVPVTQPLALREYVPDGDAESHDDFDIDPVCVGVASDVALCDALAHVD